VCLRVPEPRFTNMETSLKKEVFAERLVALGEHFSALLAIFPEHYTQAIGYFCTISNYILNE
jgi:hypothetical protein